MKLRLRGDWAVLTASAMLCMFLNSRVASAQDHVVPITELHRELRSAADARAGNQADIERVLSLPAAQDALRKVSVNQDQVRKAVSTLSDEELARLAVRARAAEQDVQGGLIVGILALIGLIVIIIIVLAIV